MLIPDSFYDTELRDVLLSISTNPSLTEDMRTYAKKLMRRLKKQPPNDKRLRQSMAELTRRTQAAFCLEPEERFQAVSLLSRKLKELRRR